MPRPVLLIHGGAGDIPDSRIAGKFKGIKEALRCAWGSLVPASGAKGGALDAVETAVRSMELDENFNAGYGSCLNTDGQVEMEASLMEGQDLRAGCVTLLRDVMHPITVARRLMEKQRHTFIGGEAAQELALSTGSERLPANALVTEGARFTLQQFKEQLTQGKDPFFARTELAAEQKTDPSGETVGAVAMDHNGQIVVGTSTGGITGKWPGRIGDTPILGSGTYADNARGGVSTTGHGETIMRYNLAQRILAAIEHKGMSAQAAADQECREMTRRIGGTGGAIVVGHAGDLGISFTSQRMAWGYIQDDTIFYGIEGQVVHQEPLS
uniref:Probable isoaspartyl peptidase/L-asparaginase GA20639 n=1 Tax=Drosophila pseudoobscura pseudoobscura TaxID=46245 RepID=ASGL1_DROPS|nr:RecName: Full=Probable isoaspartyl peptidase/L-asparaginase GA20639; AltName: Full=Beta-aspartyl-peptidase GA20639; AltName: Full=Isoaspartyl dipeptidase GA20639; AltName: Full=L-asparagine amidohydrolase GA20639; Contains: RecName: Full=Probable isoaspartyl peptidase/L-asparaginase GA20639 alpha chain; Contains: RecName: Full=Probable isoaspartyl peptidase/L-asparaginase GA20639 beta chain; Flags: Precursor [Drosophila pseudoobscura pseudoobscura]